MASKAPHANTFEAASRATSLSGGGGGGGEMLLHCRLSRSPLGMGLGTSAAMETRQARLAAVQLLPILARSGDVQAALCVTAAPAARHPQCY